MKKDFITLLRELRGKFDEYTPLTLFNKLKEQTTNNSDKIAYLATLSLISRYRGDFEVGGQYNKKDIVKYNEELKESLIDNNDSAPSDTTKWKDHDFSSIFAKKSDLEKTPYILEFTIPSGTIEEQNIAIANTFGAVDHNIHKAIYWTNPYRGGTFVYDENAGPNDGGIVFSKWVRQNSLIKNIEWFGALPSSSDNSKAIQNALNTKGNIQIPEKTYKASQSLEIKDGTKLFGSGHKSIIDGSDFTGRAFISTERTGETQLPNITSELKENIRIIEFASAHNLEQGDVFFITDRRPYSYSTRREYYNAGEMVIVAKVESDTKITAEGGLHDSYDKDHVEVYKFNNMANVIVKDLKIVGKHRDEIQDGLRLERCRSSIIDNVKIENFTYSQIGIFQSINCNVTNCDVNEDMSIDFGGDYGIVIANSQHINVAHNKGTASRHAITTGGDAELGNVVCYDIRIANNTFKTILSSEAIDFHENTGYSGIENCTSYGSILIAGHGCWVKNCVVHKNILQNSNDAGIYFFGGKSTEAQISDNTIFMHRKNGVSRVVNIIKIVIDEDTTKGGILKIADNVIHSEITEEVANSSVFALHDIKAKNCTTDIDVVIENNIFKSKGTYHTMLFAFNDQNYTCDININVTNNKGSNFVYGSRIYNVDENFKKISNVFFIDNDISEIKNMGCLFLDIEELNYTNNRINNYGLGTTNNAYKTKALFNRIGKLHYSGNAGKTTVNTLYDASFVNVEQLQVGEIVNFNHSKKVYLSNIITAKSTSLSGTATNGKPTTGKYAVGDYVVENSPASIQAIGWVCDNAGEFGTATEPTFKKFGAWS